MTLPELRVHQPYHQPDGDAALDARLISSGFAAPHPVASGYADAAEAMEDLSFPLE
jgi:hypothetical protein